MQTKILGSTDGEIAMVKCRIAVLTIALSAFVTPAAFGQAAIQEPGMFEFYHPNEDVLNAGAPTPEAALVFTTRARGAYAAIDGGNLRADFGKSSAPRRVGAHSCERAPRVGAFATQPWTYASPCEPTGNY
jgi:hypothetical protein